MKKGITFKLFLLTMGLCTFILMAIFIGQMLFFKMFYEERKINDINTSMKEFQQQYMENYDDIPKIVQLKEDFTNHHQSWITVLDENGNLKGEPDFSLELMENYTAATMSIPLYTLVDLNDMWNEPFMFQEGMELKFSGLKSNQGILPIEPIQIMNQDTKVQTGFVDVNVDTLRQWDLVDDESIIQFEKATYSGTSTITKVNIPNVGSVSPSLISNEVFRDYIRNMQEKIFTRILFPVDAEDVLEPLVEQVEINDIKYILLMHPFFTEDEQLEYVFTMTSLQPIDSAIRMMQDYYVYIAIIMFILIVLLAIYYSKKITKPLIRINQTTEKIADLDFTETLPIQSNDEIGTISQNINRLSETLQSHIEKLEQDIEKERQLETTRKQFISGVSHELKTPLSVMQSCISILKDDVAAQKREYYFAAMEKEVKKMDQLIVDMLELAKLESGTYQLRMETFYINETIAYLSKSLAIEMQKKHIQSVLNLLPVKVTANERRIEQVLTNFMMNAIRYTPEGEKVIISMTEQNDRVKIAIENIGVSIPPAELPNIWDRFYRNSSSRNRAEGGTGLGLAISKNILDLHQVEYGAENTAEGVLFYFYLQVAEQ